MPQNSLKLLVDFELDFILVVFGLPCFHTHQRILDRHNVGQLLGVILDFLEELDDLLLVGLHEDEAQRVDVLLGSEQLDDIQAFGNEAHVLQVLAIAGALLAAAEEVPKHQKLRVRVGFLAEFRACCCRRNIGYLVMFNLLLLNSVLV